MSQKIELNNENTLALLAKFVELAQTKGSFTLKEASILKKAIDTFNPEVKEKPVFVENDPDPELTAKKLLIQGADKGQSKGAYGIDDAALLYDVIEFIGRDLQQSTEVSSGSGGGGEDDQDNIAVKSIK